MKSNQEAGGIWVIDNEEEEDLLLDVLNREAQNGTPVGIDTETVGCDPGKQSPVGTAKVVCWSIAYSEPELGLHSTQKIPLSQRCFLWSESLEKFKPWLENPNAPKVGHNVFTYDRHVFANAGINLRGVAGDTLRMSRLLNADKRAKHDLKSLMLYKLGYKLGGYKELFSRPKRLKPEWIPETKLTRRKICGKFIPTLMCQGELGRLSPTAKKLIPLDEIRTTYSSRLQTLYNYASLDAKGTLELFLLLKNALMKTPWRNSSLWDLYERFWNPSLYLYNQAERNGIVFDVDASKPALKLAEQDIIELEQNLRLWSGQDINWNSWVQLQPFLYNTGTTEVGAAKVRIHGKGFPVSPICGTLKAVRKTPRGKRPTDQAAIDWLSKNVKEERDRRGLQTLLAYRKAVKGKQFLSKLPTYRDNHARIHTVLGPETDTGRCSSRKPALQQIPLDDKYGVRRAFRADDGYSLVVADYSQLEMYVLAHYLITLFDDYSLKDEIEAGDVHTSTALLMWPHSRAVYEKDPDGEFKSKYRTTAKTINYSIGYGKTAYGLGAQILDETGKGIGTEAAERLLQLYFEAKPGILKFRNWIHSFAKKHGRVPSLLGRPRPIPEAQSNDKWQVARALRQAGNSPMQAGGADIVTSAMLRLNPEPEPDLIRYGWYNETLNKYNAKFLLQIHDELIFECKTEYAEKVCAEVKKMMEDPFPKFKLKIPLKVEATVCKRWSDGK